LDGFTLTVLDGEHKEVFKKADNPAPAESVSIPVQGRSDNLARFRHAAINAAVSSGGDPAPVFASLSRLIERGKDVPTAAEAIRALPRTAWSSGTAGILANAIVSWAKSVPTADRTSADYVATVQLAGELANMLPADRTVDLRNELRNLRVSVFVVNTVREQMRYDTPRIVVEAGKSFQVIFQNNDVMPHNFVVVKPGTREKIGTASMTMLPTALDREGRAFIPSSDDIIAATKLVEPGDKAKLNVIAPNQEGDYEYVCTFPGHWMIMWGKLAVVKDVDAYLQAHPDPGVSSIPAVQPASAPAPK
jgi:azurin